MCIRNTWRACSNPECWTPPWELLIHRPGVGLKFPGHTAAAGVETTTLQTYSLLQMQNLKLKKGSVNCLDRLMWKILLWADPTAFLKALFSCHFQEERLEMFVILFQHSSQLGRARQHDSNQSPLLPAANADKTLGDGFSSPREPHAGDVEQRNKMTWVIFDDWQLTRINIITGLLVM